MCAAAVVSCGVLLINERDEVFLAHATGNRHWDVPKGLAEPGESPLQAALRETREETGLCLPDTDWLDLGRHAYRPRKDLHLFARRVRTSQVRIEDCVCSTTFVHPRSGRSLPEADWFAWVAADQLTTRCAGSMSALLVAKGLLASALSLLGPGTVTAAAMNA